MAKTATGRKGIRQQAETDLAAAIEGLGVFYLGTTCDDTGRSTAAPLLVDARRFTTHAVCVGMTGSGKTGLCLSLLQEAAIAVGQVALVWTPFRKDSDGFPVADA